MGVEIKFPLAPRHNQPELLKGSTHFSSLPAIFGVHVTGQYQGCEATIYQTDKVGLAKLANAARDASEEINDATAAIAELGAHSKFAEIGEHATTTLMWTFVRLAELRQALDEAAGDFEDALQRGNYLCANLDGYQVASESEGGSHD